MKELEIENGMLKEKVNILQQSSVICWTILTTSLKLWPNGIASWVYLRLRLARAWMHLRYLPMTCAQFCLDQIWTEIDVSSMEVEWRPLNYYHPIEIFLEMGFFAGLACTLQGTCESVLATQRKFYLRLLVTSLGWGSKLLENFGKEDSFSPQFLGLTW